jgi:Tat protein translocase TatB subunit
MFGIGYQEMFIILVVALVVFGPSRLPELAGQVGRWVRDFRRMSSDLTGEFEKTFAEVDEVKKSFQREIQSIQSEVEGVGKSARGELRKSGSGAAATAKKSPSALKSGAAAAGSKRPATAANGAKDRAASHRGNRPGALAGTLPVATKADPLVDVSFFDLDAELVVASNGAVANGAAESVEEEALKSVRRRRMTSAYGRRVAS